MEGLQCKHWHIFMPLRLNFANFFSSDSVFPTNLNKIPHFLEMQKGIKWNYGDIHK